MRIVVDTSLDQNLIDIAKREGIQVIEVTL